LQSDNGSSQVRVKVIKGKSLAKKDIFGASDPYVRIDLNTISGDVNIDSVLTKTKKKVRSSSIFNINIEFTFKQILLFYF
jgi:E3 ubiquitin-protein ligase NEDD4